MVDPAGFKLLSRPSCARSASFVALTFWIVAGVQASTFTVTNLDDSGTGSLRQAVLDANAAAGADNVAFASGVTGTISFTSGAIAISDSLGIVGPGLGALTLDANGLSRIFLVENSGATVPIDVTLSGMTITRGAHLSPSGDPFPYGGAIFSHGENLTLEAVVVSESRAYSFSAATRNCGGNVALLGLGGVDGGTLRIVNTLLATGRTESGAGGNLCVDSGTLHLERSTLSSGNCGGGFGGGGGLWLSSGTASSIVLSTITGNGGTYLGGGIYASLSSGGSLTLESSTITLNSAAIFGNGGGITSLGGEIRIENSTVSENNAAFGGGIGSAGTDLQLIDSTVSGNFSYTSGGGVYFTEGAGGSLLLRHTTVTANRSLGGGGGLVVGTLSAPDVVQLDHSILANPSVDLIVSNDPASITANYTLVGNLGTAILSGGHNLIGIDPRLGPLADNGGPTETHIPLSGSPVLNAGNPAIPSPPATDQRGFARIVGPAIDLGAVEAELESVEVPMSSPVGLLGLCALLIGAAVLRLRRGAETG